MNLAHVPYVVSGAFALQQHTGIWRNTKDLDLFLPAQAVPEALQHLQEQGFETEIRDPVWLAKAHRDGYFVDLITGMSNAIITVDQSWIDRGSRRCGTWRAHPRAGARGADRLQAVREFPRAFRWRRCGAHHFRHQGPTGLAAFAALVGEHWELLLWELVLFHYIYPA